LPPTARKSGRRRVCGLRYAAGLLPRGFAASEHCGSGDLGRVPGTLPPAPDSIASLSPNSLCLDGGAPQRLNVAVLGTADRLN
jgi:hypothetical protein